MISTYPKPQDKRRSERNSLRPITFFVTCLERVQFISSVILITGVPFQWNDAWMAGGIAKSCCPKVVTSIATWWMAGPRWTAARRALTATTTEGRFR